MTRLRVPDRAHGVQWLAAWVLPCLLHAAHAAPPHLDLEVTLDPNTRAFSATAELTTAAGPPPLQLNPLFTVSRVTSNGAAKSRAATPHHLSVAYSGILPALPQGDAREAAGSAALFVSPPGRQTSAREIGSRSIAEYEFAQPAEGIWLMAGPYEVRQQAVALDSGKTVMVRTWLHRELAGLAEGYLQDSGRYIQRYSRLIGDYPFDDFSVVASPLSHGLGMPSLSYLGRDVLRLPFIRATSLGHEVLHNWWGNGVYPDWASGNWSEGLTTFMADYAFRADQSEAAARDMRLNWLRDLSAVAAPDETALADFTSRQHGISSIVGYAKSAMLFFMLRDEIGEPAFDAGIRLLWQELQFKAASWKDLEAVFSRAAGRDLSNFFAQWLQRPASAQLVLAPRRATTPPSSVYLIQPGGVFDLLVPLRVHLASGAHRDLRVRVRERETVVELAALAAAPDVTQVELDPEWRLWRRLDASTVPPTFREVFVSPRAQLFLANTSPAWRLPATALADRLLDAQQTHEATEAQLLSSPERPALVIGDATGIRRLLPALGLAGGCAGLADRCQEC